MLPPGSPFQLTSPLPASRACSVLLVTHQLSSTGAPLVLIELGQLFARKGCEVVVLDINEQPREGDMSEVPTLHAIGLKHLDRSQLGSALEAARAADLVVVNTMWQHEIVASLRLVKTMQQLSRNVIIRHGFSGVFVDPNQTPSFDETYI